MSDISASVDGIRGDAYQMTSTKQGHDMSAFVYQHSGRGAQYNVGRRIPKPYPSSRFLQPWSPRGRNIANIPAVQARDIVSGTEKTLSPSRVNIMHDVNIRGSTEMKQQVRPQKMRRFIQSSPSRKARQDSLRDMPFLGQAQKKFRSRIEELRRRFR